LPQITYPHEIVQGLAGDLPNTRGFVLTSVKDSPLVEVPIRASRPAEPENQTILATWTYGLGRTAVFTTDVGKRWAGEWTDWSGYDQFFSQLVRWTMRPTKSDAKFTVATNVGDGQVEVVVNALNQEDEFLNFLDLQAVAVGPDLKPVPLIMRQQAPGRYVGSFDADAAGSYLVNIIPGAGEAPITTGASVPFSDEYRLRQTNLNMLEQLSQLEPDGGEPGIMTEPLDPETFEVLLKNDSYRQGLPRAMSLQDIWPYCLLIGALCLFGDVFVRRVALDYAYPLKWIAQKLRPGETAQDVERKASLQRLRSKKSQVTGELEQVKASTRFEVSDVSDTQTLDDALAGKKAVAREKSASTGPGMSQPTEQEGYTSRLLAAKKAAQKRTGDQEQD
jgi:hypothetical protein